MESLLEAIKRQDTATVKAVLNSGVRVNLDEVFGFSTPLCEACRVDSAEIVNLLLSCGASANAPSCHLNKRPLHLACDCADDDVVRSLLEAGADVNVKDDDGNTGLHLACTQSNVDVAILLLEYGADVRLEDVDGESPLLRACYAEEEELIELLLKYGAKPTGLCLMTCILHDFVSGVSILYKAAPDTKIMDVLKTISRMKVLEARNNLMHQNVNLNQEELNILLPPLHISCANPVFCSFKVVMSIVEVSQDVHAKDDAGYNSLQHACSCVNLSAIQILLAYGANPDDDGWQPMWKCFPSPSQDNIKFYLMTLKLLYVSGFRMDEESARMFLSAVEGSPGIPTDKRTQFKDLITKYRLHPLSLKELTRIKIRRQIPASIEKNVVKLKSLLPSNLLNYLRFEDLIKPIESD